MSIFTNARLHAAISAVCPIDSVAIINPVAQTTRIDFNVTATPSQKTAAQAIVTGFDWTPAADVVFQAQQAIAAATASINNGQLAAGLTTDRLIVALALVVLSEINILRAIANPVQTPRTQAQLLNAVLAQIQATAT
jgi:hypothetical protein